MKTLGCYTYIGRNYIFMCSVLIWFHPTVYYKMWILQNQYTVLIKLVKHDTGFEM